MTRRTDQDAPDQPAARQGRGLRWLLWAGAVTLLLLIFGFGGVYLRLMQGPLSLPPALQARILAQMQAGMPQNDLSLRDVSIALDETGHRAVVVIDQIEMRDAAGLRAAFPQLSFIFDGGALLRGQVLPIRAEMRGASLLLERDETGGIDLAFASNQDAARADLAETMAGFDRMFSDPRFAQFEQATGREITISLRDAATGRALLIENGQMRLARQGADLVLGVSAGLETAQGAGRISLIATRDGVARETELRLNFQDIAAGEISLASPALRWLDLLSAPLSGSIATQLRDAQGVGDLDVRLDLGAGELALEGTAQPLPFSRIATEFRYDADQGQLDLDRLVVDARDLDFSATGSAMISPDGTDISTTLALRDIMINPRDQFDAALMFSQGEAAFDLTLGAEPRLDLTRVLIRAEGFDLLAQGHAESRANGTAVDVTAQIAAMEMRDVLTYWPVDALPKTRDWIDRNLHQGQARDLAAHITKTPNAARATVNVTFAYDGLDLSPLRDMPPLRDMSGVFALAGPRLTITGAQGVMRAPTGGDVAVPYARFVVPDTRPRGPAAELDLEITGAIPDILTLFAGPPVNLFPQEGRLDPESLATGQARLSGRIDLNLVERQPMEEMRFDVTGALDAVASDRLVPNRLLEAETLDLRITSADGVIISGDARLDGQPLSGQWQRPDLRRTAPNSALTAQMPLSSTVLSALGLGLPEGMVGGAGMMDISVALFGPSAPPQMALRSDLQGVDLEIAALGWAKAAQDAGDLSVDITLGAAPRLEAFRLEGAGLVAEGSGDLTPQGALQQLRLNRFVIQDWLDVTGNLRPQGVGQPPAIEITSGRLDLRSLPQATPPIETARGPLTVMLDELRLGAGLALRDLRAELSQGGGGLAGAYRGQLNGAVAVEGALAPLDGGGVDIRMRAADGGAVLRSAGVMRNLYGGAMDLQLQSPRGSRLYEGRLQITNPRMRDAPVMAELLNAVSVIGLLEQLSGDGINLGEVDVRFTLEPSKVTVHQGTAIGPSLGISMDGGYQMDARVLDFRGVLTPLYVLNGVIGGIFARRDEGLFGFNFRLSGPPDDPDVRVNPLSILVPGILRDLMRPQLETNTQ